MQEFLNKGIKPLINEYPAIEAILASRDIGCTSCQLGTCLLKDVIEIHNLSPEEEHELFSAIAAVIYPGQNVSIPVLPRKNPAKDKGGAISPPVKMLMDEHRLILRLIALIPSLADKSFLASEGGLETIAQATGFIREYADRYHHAKEEDLLFPYFEQSQEIIQVMLEDHVHGRGFVKAMLEGIDKIDLGRVSENLLAYRELLSGHISREDTILFPWMDRSLNTNQIGKLYTGFFEVNQRYSGIEDKYQQLMLVWESKF